MNRVTVSSYPTRVTLHCGQNKVTLRYAQKGERGIGISNVALDDKAHLIITYDDGKTQDAGAALGDVASVKDGIDSSYKKIQASEANVTKLEASAKANADKAQQALQDTQNASASGVDAINTLVSEKMTYLTSTFNSLLTQTKADIDQWERDAENKIHKVRTYSLEQIKTAHDDAMVDIERSVNKAEAWAVSETTPDKEPDFESPTGLTQSSRSWALLSKKKLHEAYDTLKDIKDNETNVSNMKNDVAELLRKTQISEQNTHNYMDAASASQKAAKESEQTAATHMENAKTSEVNAKASETASADSASKAHTSELNAKTSETKSASSASSASTSASNAKTSETNAKTSETSASSSATTAKNWAVATTSPDGATDTDSNTGKTQSSRSWALASKASANSASSSASTAITQASSATASAKSASDSAASASSSATSASSYASAASNSASAAATSATNASNSETQASGYKASASDSATAAASSATSASTSATNAKASMNTANTAASSANTSATSASTSASNAAKAEIAAKTAQAAAEKARDDANTAVNKLTGAMKYAGQVDNYSDLESYTKNKGDVWNIVNADPAHGIKAGDNVAWNGTDWDNLSGTVDLSIYAEKADYQKVITSATANGATITFNYKDGTTSTATVNNVASATAATNDAKGQRIDSTYEKIADASNVHTSLQNSINSLSTSKQNKLTFDTTPIADSTNPVTSGGIKTALDGKPSNTGAGASGTWPISISGKAAEATKADAIVSSAATEASTAERPVWLSWEMDNSRQVVSPNLTYNCSTKTLTANNFKGNLTGNASTATKLQTPRNISLTGNALGSATFDGSIGVSINTTVNTVNNQGEKTAIRNGTSEPAGLNLYKVYQNGYPTSCGNLISIGGTGGGELLAGWSDSWDITQTSSNIEHLYYRSRKGSGTLWSDWSTIAFISDIDKYISAYAPTKIGTGAIGTWPISVEGNAETATKLETARTIQTNLASTSSASFDGTTNVTPGVTGILPVANGGTGASSLVSITVGKATADASGNDIVATYATKAYADKVAKAAEDKAQDLYNQLYLPRYNLYIRSALPTSAKTSITINPMALTINGSTYDLIDAKTLSLNDSSSWDSSTYATAANRAGKDFYIYACQPTSGTSPNIILSANGTVPTGYTALTSRKIGGFHCECLHVGTVTDGNPMNGYATGDIIPYSIWDLKHRPKCSPEGMVYVKPLNVWISIYLMSWDGSKLVSTYNGVQADGASAKAFSGTEFAEYLARANMRLPKYDEYVIFAKGIEECVNVKGSADVNTTGGHYTTNSKRIVSNYGIEDCAGVIWQWLSDVFGSDFAISWNTSSNRDARNTRGDCYGGGLRRALAGGRWGDGANCGSRASHVVNWSAVAHVDFACRGASEPLVFEY